MSSLNDFNNLYGSDVNSTSQTEVVELPAQIPANQVPAINYLPMAIIMA